MKENWLLLIKIRCALKKGINWKNSRKKEKMKNKIKNKSVTEYKLCNSLTTTFKTK